MVAAVTIQKRNIHAAAGTEEGAAAPMPFEVSHHDPDRDKVSTTAIVVAASRAIESQKPPSDRLFNDPEAVLLCGAKAVEDLEAALQKQPEKDAPAFSLSSKVLHHLVCARVRWLDEAVSAPKGPTQVVIMGAGLDSRAFRLEAWQDKDVYEVDFPEVLGYKDRQLAKLQPMAKTRRSVPVAQGVGAQDEAWGAALEEAGFDRSRPSLWLIEGFFMYLNEPELDALFAEVNRLAVPGSEMALHLVGPGCSPVQRSSVRDKSHARKFLDGFGWSAREIRDLVHFANSLGREVLDSELPKGYVSMVGTATRGGCAASSKI